jgi:nucleoside-diphosphate-sugar epimerase
LHIDDFSEAINLLIQKQANGVYNICSGQEYTIKNIVTSITNQFNKENQLIFNAKLDRIDFPKYICGSNDKLVNTIEWTPSIDIKNGISNMIKKEI